MKEKGTPKVIEKNQGALNNLILLKGFVFTGLFILGFWLIAENLLLSPGLRLKSLIDIDIKQLSKNQKIYKSKLSIYKILVKPDSETPKCLADDLSRGIFYDDKTIKNAFGFKGEVEHSAKSPAASRDQKLRLELTLSDIGDQKILVQYFLFGEPSNNKVEEFSRTYALPQKFSFSGCKY